MTNQDLSHAEHVAFYQRQQLFRKRKQFELKGHPAEASTTLQPRATKKQVSATTQIPIAPPIDRTVRLRLHIDTGPDAGREFDLAEGEYVIGRSPESNIQINDDTVSHRHAKIVVTSRRATIQDLGSTNGSKLGDVSLRGTAILSPGDRMFLGEAEISVDTGD
jgi:pSer/pThr/pTyr-binding forkhead associated (FHA) protein